MRQIIITLLLSIAVFVATLVVTNTYVSRKTIEAADYNNATALDNFQLEMNGDILLTEQSARCFMAGNSWVKVSRDGTRIIIDDKCLPQFKDEIYNNIIHFLRVNKYYHSVMFIIDENVNRDYFGGKGFYAPCVVNGDSTMYDIAENYDFSKSEHYKKLKKEKGIFWTVPSSSSPVKGKFMTMFIPLFLDNGRFLGAFCVSLDIKVINKKLQKHLPYGEEHSGMFLVDENDNIFSAYPEWILEPKHENAFRERGIFRKHDYKGVDFKTYYYEGTKYFIYQRDKLFVPWRIYTICESDAVYCDAKRASIIVLSTSLIGMILMMICCIVISRQVRKNMRQKAKIEEELKLAANVQKSMLKPVSLVSKGTLSAFMRPAREVGGDLYDYIEEGGKLIFCIGDVSGKGMPAALFMTQVVSLFRNAVRNTHEPAQIVSQINDVLAQDNKDMTFCTFFVGVLSGTKLTFCNAGHNPPVLIPPAQDGAGGAFLKVRPNTALGLIEGFPYKAEEMELSIGDTFLLYTDGVTEAKNKKHKTFGEERLLNVLNTKTSSFIPQLTSAIEAFVGNAEQSDDITIIEIHRL